jgi:hypothetical protein
MNTAICVDLSEGDGQRPVMVVVDFARLKTSRHETRGSARNGKIKSVDDGSA